MVKYAVLISSGNAAIDDLMYHSEYWYDLFLMYKMLIENGFSHNHIFVLYGEGTDFNSSHAEYNTPTQFPGVNKITNYSNHKQSVQNIFSWLATGNPAEGIPALTSKDFLFVWWMGHGIPKGPCSMSLDISNTGEKISDTDFAGYVSGITQFMKKAFFFMTCHSGGMLDNLQGINTVVETSSACDSVSYSDSYDVVHGEFTYLAACALREVTQTGTPVLSDFDINNLVSLGECFAYVSAQPMSSVPQMSDVTNIAPCIFIKMPNPGKDIEIMSKDHVNDDGTTPSNYQVWYHGPDLWVRNLPDGGTSHQTPEYGQTNYVYARIHNIGCGTATNINVHFSWCEQTAWANPALWNPIGSVTIPALASLQSVTVYMPWSSLPLPGVYCLHTRLNCPGDPENTQGEAYLDNNKVQINVDIKDSSWGMKRTFIFFVENAGKKKVPVDLEINAIGMLEKATLLLELPPDTRFKEVKNAKLTRKLSGAVDLCVKSGLSFIKGISLAPNSEERLRLTISITTPMEAKIGQKSVIFIEEKGEGKSKGGIQFISKVSERQVIIQKLLRRKANLFRGIAEELSLRLAIKISRLFTDQLQRESWQDRKKFLKAMVRIAKLEKKAFKTVKIQKLCRNSIGIGEKYRTSLQKLKDALDRRDLTRVVEAEEETLLYAGALLADYIKIRQPRLIKPKRQREKRPPAIT